jgi:hypothetical protein
LKITTLAFLLILIEIGLCSLTAMHVGSTARC